MIPLKIEKRNFSISFSRAFLISPGYYAPYCSKQQWWEGRPVLGGARCGAELLFWGEIFPSPIKRAVTEKMGSKPLGLGFTSFSKFFPVPILSRKKPAPPICFPHLSEKTCPRSFFTANREKICPGTGYREINPAALSQGRAIPSFLFFLPFFLSSFLSFLLVSGLIVSSSAEVK